MDGLEAAAGDVQGAELWPMHGGKRPAMLMSILRSFAYRVIFLYIFNRFRLQIVHAAKAGRNRQRRGRFANGMKRLVFSILCTQGAAACWGF
jgi:hypothetical protein